MVKVFVQGDYLQVYDDDMITSECDVKVQAQSVKITHIRVPLDSSKDVVFA